jgi:hypothetical protein
MKWSSYAVVGLVAAQLMMMCTAARGWEADVHSGLTKWIALQAGFSEEEAGQIAAGDGSMDESLLTAAPTSSLIHIILLGDVNAAGEMQSWHFPSYATLPCPPESRAVGHDSAAARDPVEQAINAPLSKRDKALFQLGQRLHAFQDSWSHEGIPDTPFHPFPYEVRPDLIWSHPAKRGGWHSHNADLTYLHVDQTVEMAGRTYDMVHAFLTKYPTPDNKSGGARTEVERGVRVFAPLSTREDKKAWFLKQGFSRADVDKIAGALDLPQNQAASGGESSAPEGTLGFLTTFFGTSEAAGATSDGESTSGTRSGTTSDGSTGADTTGIGDGGSRVGDGSGGRTTGSGSTGPRSFPEPSVFELIDLLPEVPYDDTQDLSRAAQRLMDSWVLNQNIDDARSYFDADEIKAQLAPFGFDAAATNQWISRFLTMWLLQDHGFVNAAGHGMPDAAGYSTLPESPTDGAHRDLKTIKVGRLRDAIEAGVRPFKIAPAPSEINFGISPAWIVYFSFNHAPRDLVMLVMAQRGGFFRNLAAGPNWMVVRALWMAE